MSLRGHIIVDSVFVDSASTTGVATQKTLSIVTSNEYDDGKAAVVSGTCGTSAVTISLSAPGYTAASGSAVSFSNVSRIVFSAGSTTLVKCVGGTGKPLVLSRASQAAVSEVGATETTLQVSVDATAGTSSYTLVMYGA
jgi:hypothetical protein